ncbi:MAG TPA: M20/M25/M40 family metallo-hydrolase [Gemmatimonadales bacterium]|nr:M20/M25/M40 family metallo-hydrolase [Gemmatimonadales bacterium]
MRRAAAAGRTGAALALCLAGGLAGAAGAAAQQPARLAEAADVLGRLIETYGVSGHEAPVRDAVIRLLPAWARPSVDTAGNVLVRAGSGAPLVVFVAHLDEIGFVVTAIRDDGGLDLRAAGGFYPSLFEGEPALVHTSRGVVPAVFVPRDSAGPAPRRSPGALRADPGTASRAATEALGIRPGDAVTMPKAFVPLAGSRATGRSMDDRVGCAAQLLALRRLDPRALRHAVVFVFSVREEIGLEGAKAAAADLAAERPARVHAIDTFVSADAPLEIPTFADAPLGGGAVVRAIDNSAVAPPALVDSLLALARSRGIPLAAGTTNGGNDGSVFTAYGVSDVGLGWPLRYAHSPAEVIDLTDLVALADVIQAIAEGW